MVYKIQSQITQKYKKLEIINDPQKKKKNQWRPMPNDPDVDTSR